MIFGSDPGIRYTTSRLKRSEHSICPQLERLIEAPPHPGDGPGGSHLRSYLMLHVIGVCDRCQCQEVRMAYVTCCRCHINLRSDYNHQSCLCFSV